MSRTCVLALLMVASVATVAADDECTLFVATNGSDSNSGTSVDSPFRTIQRAIDATPEMRRRLAATATTTGAADATSAVVVVVCLRSGTFFLDNTLHITAAHSSTSGGGGGGGGSLRIQGFPADLAAHLPRPVLSGGALVGPFAPPPIVTTTIDDGGGGDAADDPQPWSAPIPAGFATPPRLMFAPQASGTGATDGGYLQRARMPRKQSADAYSRHLGDAST